MACIIKMKDGSCLISLAKRERLGINSSEVIRVDEFMGTALQKASEARRLKSEE